MQEGTITSLLHVSEVVLLRPLFSFYYVFYYSVGTTTLQGNDFVYLIMKNPFVFNVNLSKN